MPYLLIAFLVIGFAAVQETSTSRDSVSSATPKESIGSRMRTATLAFQAGDCDKAIIMFREVIADDPTNILAHNLAGNCSLRLRDYPAAIDSFQHALQLQPDEWHNLAGLMRSYTLAGRDKERDQEREHLRQLDSQGRLPKNFSYVFDFFMVGDRQVEGLEFLHLSGRFNLRYDFNVYTPKGDVVYRLALESDDIGQPLWAKEHPKEAAAGYREFSLDGYSSNSHQLYRFYDGEPHYEKLRDDVKQVLLGNMKPLASTRFNQTTIAPQTAPNQP